MPRKVTITMTLEVFDEDSLELAFEDLETQGFKLEGLPLEEKVATLLCNLEEVAEIREREGGVDLLDVGLSREKEEERDPSLSQRKEEVRKRGIATIEQAAAVFEKEGFDAAYAVLQTFILTEDCPQGTAGALIEASQHFAGAFVYPQTPPEVRRLLEALRDHLRCWTT